MTHTTFPAIDVIDQLTGIRPGEPADALRARRPQARAQAQQSYLALFEPDAPPSGDSPTFTRAERFAVAAFVARLHGQSEVADFYAQRLASSGVAATGPRLSAALAHADLLVLRPRDADAAALQALLDAGWSTNDIVTLSQLIAFLSFQIRVVVGLRSLAARAESPAIA